jgi:predicted amidophosphoribosyltransferase
MPGPYCPRCETSVKLEQDGKSCSNCGRKLVIAAPKPPPPPARKPTQAA